MTITWQPGMTLEDVEKQVVLEAFRFFQGNKTQTSRALDIAIRTLEAKLDKYGVKHGGISKVQEHNGKDLSHGVRPETRSRVEPPSQVSAQQSVSMRKR